jgi:hypothetical protein
MIRIWSVSFLVFIALSITLPGEAIPAKKLYDDFSTGYLSSDKWFPREYVKEISDGKLVFKLGNSSGMGAEYWPGMFRNNLGVASPSPETITAFESEITVMEATPDSAPNSRSFARIAGQFYNSNESDGQSGEIAFEIMIGDRGNGGLEAFWEASRVMENDPSDFEQIASGTVIDVGTLEPGVPYLVKVVYDNDRTLTVTVNGVTDEYTGPEKKRPAVNPVRSIGSCIDAADGSNDGFIHATFDNVVFNNAAEIHEDFSSPLIDLSKWDQTELVRECSNGHLRANVRRISGGRHASTYLTTGRDTPYLEAKVRIESDTQLSVGASGIARLGGYYYNESRGPGSGVDYNRYEGDVFALIRLRYDSDGTIQAQAWIGRSDDADENNFTDLFWHVFSTPIELDTYYVLSISYENNQIIFQCEDEQVVFNIQTETYPPYGIHRQLRTWLRADSGESGYFKASYDDIYVADSLVTATILSNASPDHTITSGSNEQVYGTSTSNVITVESGARAELINFPGQNSIQIQSNPDLFSVYRSGTVVTFQGSDGTVLKIPATQTVQTIEFTDREPLTLSIHDNKVMLDDQEINLNPVAISTTMIVVEKPIIYLYPESIQEIYVAFEKPDSVLLTTTYPEYSIKNGWNVLAYPDGTLYDMETGLEFYAIYWEGFTPKTGNYETGFVIKSEDSATFLETSLEQLGLIRREANEFIVYWLPELEKSPYNFIHFSTEDWGNDVPLEIIPEPATLIRFMMYYQPLEYPIQVEPQMLESPVRKGFTVVEWGGGIIE